MGKIFFFLAFILVADKINAQKTAMQPPKDAALYVEVDDADHDFGNILFKKHVKYDVHFQNISQDTLTLTNVTVSCGCTVPEWKHGPYAPRDTFSVRITFNGYADGKFNRTLTMLFNNDIVKILRFHGVGYQKLPVTVDNNTDYDDDYDMETMAISKKMLHTKSQEPKSNDKIKIKMIGAVSY